jgi:hypothetical protein
MYYVLYGLNFLFAVEEHHLYGAILCYKEQAVEKETHGISSKTLELDYRVPGLNINQDTNYPDMGISWFPQVPPGKC